MEGVSWISVNIFFCVDQKVSLRRWIDLCIKQVVYPNLKTSFSSRLFRLYM
jgi:hypothetical protein